MKANDRDKRIETIYDNVKWGRGYSEEDIDLIDEIVIHGHEDVGILGVAIYAFGRIHDVCPDDAAKNSKYLLQHLKVGQPLYPKTAAIFALKRMNGVERHWEFLLEECEREKEYHLSDEDDFDNYYSERSIKRSEFINFVKSHSSDTS